MIAIYKDPKIIKTLNKQLQALFYTENNDTTILETIDSDTKDKKNNILDEKVLYKYKFVQFPFITYPILIVNTNPTTSLYKEDDMYIDLEQYIPKVFLNQPNNEGVKDYINKLAELKEIELLKNVYNENTYVMQELDDLKSDLKLVSYKTSNINSTNNSRKVFNETIKESVYLYLNNFKLDIASDNAKSWNFEVIQEEKIDENTGKILQQREVKLIVKLLNTNKFASEEYKKCCFLLKNWSFLVKNNLTQSINIDSNSIKELISYLKN